jgi:plasmid stabilization system protein ParE
LKPAFEPWRKILHRPRGREDLADRRHRFFPAGSYLIVYRSQTKPLQIVRILHASRDVQMLLDIEAGETDDLD